MKSNTSAALGLSANRTHEGARAVALKPLQELRRSIMACLLFEDTFYESGVDIAARVSDLISKCAPQAVADLAREARHQMNLRHAPLWLAHGLLGRTSQSRFDYVNMVDAITKRPDDVTELLAMYWRAGKRPLASKLRFALARALQKFDAYQLSKYAARGPIRLRDVLFMTHAKPKNDEQAGLWKKLADDTLPTANTWESKLSAGENKREAFEGMLRARSLGGLAILRNLRNMAGAGVDKLLVETELLRLAPKSGILPFQFVSAARAVPQWEPLIERAMFASLAEMKKLPGVTVLLLDASGSMDAALSEKSTLNRLDAAKALGMLAREVCEDARVFSFSDDCIEHPARRGFALGDAVGRTRGGTRTGAAVTAINARVKYDRIIIFTDEQSHDALPLPQGRGYVMNVAAYKPSIAYGPWVSVSGFSESLLRYIAESEAASTD